MLNNKYLAVVLSVVAVAVVVYQVFIRKPDNVTRPTQDKPMFTAQGRPRPAQPAPPQSQAPPPQSYQAPAPQDDGSSPSPGMRTPTTGTSDGLIIDFNSEILLERIDPQIMQPYPKQQLPNQFGTPIFSGGQPEDTSAPQQPTYTREVKFELNAIIMDANRKLAIINDKILKVGDNIQGAVIQNIEKSKVILSIEQKQIVLSTNSRIQSIRLLKKENKNEN